MEPRHVHGGVERGAGVDGKAGRVDLFSAVTAGGPDDHDVGQFRLRGIGQVHAQAAQRGGQTLRSERQHPGPGMPACNVLGGCAAGGNEILVADSDSLRRGGGRRIRPGSSPRRWCRQPRRGRQRRALPPAPRRAAWLPRRHRRRALCASGNHRHPVPSRGNSESDRSCCSPLCGAARVGRAALNGKFRGAVADGHRGGGPVIHCCEQPLQR